MAGIQDQTGTLRRVYMRAPRGEDLKAWRDFGWRAEPDARRAVVVERAKAAVPIPVHAREHLLEGAVVRGPALVDSADTTVWVPPGHEARVGPSDALVIEEVAS